jgi:hypothetical protein
MENLFQIRRDLFNLILGLDISKESKEQYLGYLTQLDPRVYSRHLERRDDHNNQYDYIGFVSKGERINLKSFFEGEDVIKVIKMENGCFEREILPYLPDEYVSPGLAFSRFDLDGYAIIIPVGLSNTNFTGLDFSYEKFLQTEYFSLHDMLAIFVKGIKRTERFIRPENNHFEWLTRGKRSFFDISGKHVICNPKEKGTIMRRFSVYYNPKEEAWGINYYNSGD